MLEKAVSERGVFRQHYQTDDLDASLLLLLLLGFLPGSDERMRATVLAIFTICSFWLVSALAPIEAVSLLIASEPEDDMQSAGYLASRP